MPLLGADPDALRTYANRLRSGAEQLDLAGSSLERRVRSAGWQGADAERFGRDWQTRQRPALRHISDRFRDAATSVDRHALEQLEASGPRADDALGRAPGAFGRAPGAPGAPRSPGAQASTDLPRPAAPPRSELRLLGGTELLGGVMVGSLAHDVTIQAMGGGRSRVVVTESGRAGVAVTAGASARLGGGTPILGASADASGTVGTVVRREYLVADRDLWPTVAKVEAELAVGRALEGAHAIPGLGLAMTAGGAGIAVWDRILDVVPGPDVDLLGAIDRLAIAPEPERVEQLAELTIDGGLGGALGSTLGLSGAAGLSGAIRFGTATEGGFPVSRIVELDGAVAASLSGSLIDSLDLDLPGSVGTIDDSVTIRLEFPQRSVDGIDLIISTTASDGVTERYQTSNLAWNDDTRTAALSSATVALGHLGSGESVAALTALATLDLSSASITTTTGVMTVSDHTTGAGGSVGEGAGVALSADGGVQFLERTT